MSDAGSKSLTLSLRNIYETLVISLPTVAEALVGRVTKEACDERLARWAAHIMRNADVRLEIRGQENLAHRKAYLVMSNHQSLYDVPVLFHAIGPNLRMVTKKELFQVPIWGPAMLEAGFISIDRHRREGAIESLRRAREVLSSGVHVWIAPEGTRSRTGELLPFKKGGFNLAMDTAWPILPVSLRGTRDVLRADGVRSVAGANVTVTLHPPIEPGPYTAHDDRKHGRDHLMADVRKHIESGL